MKKLSAIILTGVFALTLSACDFNAGESIGEKTPASNPSQITESEITSVNSATDTSQAIVSQDEITRENAIKIALDHAGFKEKDVINLTAELDRDFNHTEWEVEFDQGGYEYSYDINAKTGDIIKNEKEVD